MTKCMKTMRTGGILVFARRYGMGVARQLVTAWSVYLPATHLYQLRRPPAQIFKHLNHSHNAQACRYLI